ncbi:hypothetical protein AAMO2058_000301500 [Amorphochlora amoebiformis]
MTMAASPDNAQARTWVRERKLYQFLLIVIAMVCAVLLFNDSTGVIFREPHGVNELGNLEAEVAMVTAKTMPVYIEHPISQERAGGELGRTGGIDRGPRDEHVFRVAVIGGGGFVGSALSDLLVSQYQVTRYDRYPRATEVSKDIIIKSSKDINQTEIQRYHAVIFLGGLTGRKACDQNPEMVQDENIDEPYRVAMKMKRDQLLVFASTSAITEGSGSTPVGEEYVVNQNLLDSYSLSMYRRENKLRELAMTQENAPKLVGLRFGTVVGRSKGQRTDLLYFALMRSAYTTGVLKLRHLESNRAFLALSDLSHAIRTILQKPSKIAKFEIFHLKSFNTDIPSVATEIAMHTGARIEPRDVSGPQLIGFHLDASKFENRFGFKFRGTRTSVTLDLLNNIPDCLIPRGVHEVRPLTVGYNKDEAKNDKQENFHNHTHYDSIPCPVCGSHELQSTLDLGEQPLANDFQPTAEEAQACPRHKLHLVRCRKCNHLYLSTMVNRQALFSKYLYKSGTSRTLQEYFKWLAQKVASEIVRPSRNSSGKVLEIASNDGSQLDQFKKIGWDTYGVDPAANIVPESVQKGHKAKVGFWGVGEFDHLPPPTELDAIVAQNVFAHVPSPLAFLKACKKVMSPFTKLYIQTSQCNMHQKGQFDTAYHEHISFFTAHSFRKAAELAGLHMAAFELTPIHGTSCLVTYVLPTENRSVGKVGPTAQKRINQEDSKDGLTHDFFYIKYGNRARFTRDWISHQLAGLHKSGYAIGAYGAAAKGMVLLHFMLTSPDSEKWKLKFVVDDAPMKQNMFCPGTDIPVKPKSYLKTMTASKESKPLALIILAWNFWPEIKSNIAKVLIGTVTSIIAILPFPTAKIVKLRFEKGQTGVIVKEQTLIDIPYHPTPWNHATWPTPRREMTLVTHFYNEELLMPYFIRHHAHMFDRAILIDYGSSDATRNIVAKLAPSTWRVVAPENAEFDAKKLDLEVEKWEQTRPNDWKITLTTTEFLLHPYLRKEVAQKSVAPGGTALRFPGVIPVGNDSNTLVLYDSLVEQRSLFNGGVDGIRGAANKFCHRYIHCGLVGHYYETGRDGIISSPKNYSTEVSAEVSRNNYWDGLGLIVKFSWTPWPEVRFRKTQIGAKVPLSNRVTGVVGQHHLAWMNEEKLTQHKYKLWVPTENATDLKDANADNLDGDERLALAWKTYHEAVVPRDVKYSLPH